MTTLIGHDPDRIVALDAQTRRAIAGLRNLRTTDPAAAAAARTVAATIRLLEDQWMPLILAIRGSQILVHWTRAALDDHRFAAMSDDRLIAEIFALEAAWATTPGWYDQPDLGLGGRDDDSDDGVDVDALTHELEQRVARDAAFGELLLATAGDVDVLLFVLGRGSFPAHVLEAAVRDVVGRPDRVGPDGLRRALLTDVLVGRLAEHPQAALDFLQDSEMATRLLDFDEGLGIWTDRPATPGVAALVHAGLVGAVTMEPGRRADGFDTFDWFIGQANDLPVDRDGFPPGVATGLAIAMQHYVPTFIHSIDNLDSGGAWSSSGIHADRTGDGLDDALADYEEMTDFFGALLHQPAAVSHLGLLVAATAEDVAAERTTLSDAADLAGLLRDAARNEDVEAEIATAARAAQRGVVLDALAAATKAATGVGGAAKFVFDASTKFVEHLATSADDDPRAEDRSFDPGSLTRHLVQLAMIRRLVRDAGYRQRLDIESPAAEWAEVGELLADADELEERGASAEDRQTATQRIVNRVRELGGGAVLDPLDEHGTLAGLPNRDVQGD